MKLRMLALVLMSTGLTGCFYGPEPEYESSAYEAGAYQYTYYPDYEVYYYEPQRIYYWNEDGRWRYGSALPPAYPHLSAGVSVQLNSPKPYMQHEYVVTHYGGRAYRHGPRRTDHDDD